MAALVEQLREDMSGAEIENLCREAAMRQLRTKELMWQE